jgi:hypothetical protein
MWLNEKLTLVQLAGIGITVKWGLTGDFPALSGTLIRMVVVAAVLWGNGHPHRAGAGDSVPGAPTAAGHSLSGGWHFLQPFLGVTFSLVAVQATAVGIAGMLTALPPVFLLPIGRLVFRGADGAGDHHRHVGGGDGCYPVGLGPN